MKHCCICNNTANEDGAILTISGYGNPRILCEECEKDIDTVKYSKELGEIETAMSSLADKLSFADALERQSFEATSESIAALEEYIHLCRLISISSIYVPSCVRALSLEALTSLFITAS
jgi:hypothetical protein